MQENMYLIHIEMILFSIDFFKYIKLEFSGRFKNICTK